MFSLILASYKIPHDAGDGDVSVISLGGDGGGMLANINRWRMQVGLDPIGEDAIKTHTKAIESKIGTFTAMTLVNDGETGPSKKAVTPSPTHLLYSTVHPFHTPSRRFIILSYEQPAEL